MPVIDLNSNIIRTTETEGDVVSLINWLAMRKRTGWDIRGLTSFLDTFVDLLSAGF